MNSFQELARLIRRAERALSYWHQPAAWHDQRERWQVSLTTYEDCFEVVPSLSITQLDESSKGQLEGNRLLPPSLLVDWLLVRRVCAGNKWHKANDKLSGKQKWYGDGFRSEAVMQSFGMPFAHEEYNQFLFSTGNGKHWLIADRKEVEAHARGEAGLRTIIASSKSLSEQKVDWAVTAEGDTNPFYISIDSFDEAKKSGEMLYGENCSEFYCQWQAFNQGCNVWVRRRPSEDEKHTLRRPMNVLKQPTLDEALLVPWETVKGVCGIALNYAHHGREAAPTRRPSPRVPPAPPVYRWYTSLIAPLGPAHLPSFLFPLRVPRAGPGGTGGRACAREQCAPAATAAGGRFAADQPVRLDVDQPAGRPNAETSTCERPQPL